MRSLRFLVGLVLIAGTLSAQSFVTVRGPELIDAHGKPLLLRGINLGNWLVPEGYMFKFDTAASPRMIHGVLNELIGPGEAVDFWRRFRDVYITRQDIRFIRQAGFNSVRVPFSFRLFVREDEPSVWGGPGFEMLDRVVGWCREEGLLVVLDMHCAPGGQTGDNIDDSWGMPFLLTSPLSQQLTIEVWRRIAEHFRNEPTVIGYDLLNEPIPHFADTTRLYPLLEPLYKRIVAAVREVDTTHIVILGGARWNTNFQIFGPPFDRKAVYTFHKYWMPPEFEAIQEYVEFRDRWQVPIYMGESGENTDEWINTYRTLLDRHKIGWHFWPYKKLDATSCFVSIKRPDGWETIRRFAARPRVTYADLRANRPNGSDVTATLEEYLRNCAFDQTTVNKAYIEALGGKIPESR
ncbi:MAG: glycoside hydrolase family 5 protein [Bacteroidetes bacterium]|jgi:hypothetical protein|nr:glycoside hydrolase family 5 protein [Bacteroidota bacterium]